MREKRLFHISSILMTVTLIVSCQKEKTLPVISAENCVVIVVDGLRNVDGWGSSSKENIPFIATKLAPEGTVLTSFYNDGVTETMAGHTALLTGHYQQIANNGTEQPDYVNYLSLWRRKYNRSIKDAWIIASKDKIAATANTNDPDWDNLYPASTDCGVSGLGSGYRHDSITMTHIYDTLQHYHPSVVLINLREPDFSGHAGDWNAYLNGIKQSDKYCYELWTFLQQDSFYKDNTNLIITNDHGRHSDGIGAGFAGHGDECEGCRHIFALGIGPDISNSKNVTTRYNQLDLSATIAYMIGVNLENSDGKLMYDLFD